MPRRARRKLALALLLCAGGALAVDLLVLRGGPAEASAEALGRSDIAGGEADQAGSNRLTALAQTLELLRESTSETSLPNGLFAALPAQAGPAQVAGREPGDVTMGTPQAGDPGAPRLSGVIVGRHGGVAILDGQAVRTGETFGPWRLVAITDRGARLERDGASVTLQMTPSAQTDPPAPDGPGDPAGTARNE